MSDETLYARWNRGDAMPRPVVVIRRRNVLYGPERFFGWRAPEGFPATAVAGTHSFMTFEEAIHYATTGTVRHVR